VTFSIRVRELEGKATIEERAGNARTHNPYSSDAHSVHWKHIQQHTLIVPKKTRRVRGKIHSIGIPQAVRTFCYGSRSSPAPCQQSQTALEEHPNPHRKTVSQIDEPTKPSLTPSYLPQSTSEHTSHCPSCSHPYIRDSTAPPPNHPRSSRYQTPGLNQHC
jgi:hypothetical protein